MKRMRTPWSLDPDGGAKRGQETDVGPNRAKLGRLRYVAADLKERMKQRTNEFKEWGWTLNGVRRERALVKTCEVTAWEKKVRCVTSEGDESHHRPELPF